jgi:hypothetical protein
MSPASTRDLIGFPVVPPPIVTGGVVRLRRALLRAHRRAAPAPICVLEGLFGLYDNRVLGLLVSLGIPDLLDRPKTVADLAAATGSNADALERVLRYAAGRQFLGHDRRGRYRANRVTAVLRRDHPNSWSGWVEFAGADWFWQAFRALDASVREGRSGMEVAFGTPYFDYVNRMRPDAGAAFNRAMAAGGSLQAMALSKRLDWATCTTVCDVGGGTGATIEYLLSRHPRLQGIVFDLPEVVAKSRPGLTTGSLAGRCQLVGGSFFEEVPARHDRYLLLAVVHDWSDDQAVALLTCVRRAMGPTSRVVVVESVLPDRPNGDFAEASHLMMRVLATGRERSAGQLTALFERAGLALERSLPLATGFTAFVLNRPARRSASAAARGAR